MSTNQEIGTFELRKTLAMLATMQGIWGVPGLPLVLKAIAPLLDQVDALTRRVEELEARK